MSSKDIEAASKDVEDLEAGFGWHLIGTLQELKRKPCRKIFMSSQPLALFYVANGDRFFLSNSACPHARGPLEQGDIEDVNGSIRIVCPLHYYTFDLTTGESLSGLKLKIYKTEVRDDDLYGYTPTPVSLTR